MCLEKSEMEVEIKKSGEESDGEFVVGDEEDDETTLAAEEAVSPHTKGEALTLEEEQNLPIEELLKQYEGYTIGETFDSDNEEVGDAETKSGKRILIVILRNLVND